MQEEVEAMGPTWYDEAEVPERIIFDEQLDRFFNESHREQFEDLLAVQAQRDAMSEEDADQEMLQEVAQAVINREMPTEVPNFQGFLPVMDPERLLHGNWANAQVRRSYSQ